jgi:acetylornithine deacetylase/succinyl-diaminopimelate desuccinylase-like protein
LLAYVRAAQAWLATAGKLPINLKLLIEGEEEIGSPNLMPFVRDRADLLKCDGILISDTGLFDDGQPTITYGTRGICYKEVRLSGPKFNLHSGSHGGPVANPGNALARLIALLHDERGRVNIPGFYDDVLEISDEERALAARFPLDEESYAAELGVPGLAGEEGYSVEEQRSARPTLDVNGVYGGYMEEGASTVIPAMVGAKISMRLVPNQAWADISAKFDRTIRERCPHTVRCEILDHACAEPYVAPLDWPAVQAAEQALKEAFGRDVAFIREGGTLPILRMFKEHLGADSLLLGLASPRCNAHGPNEKVNLADLDRGAEAVLRLMEHLR